MRTVGSECDVIYEPSTRISGQWISPYNTLLYKRPSESSDLKCRYTFQVESDSTCRDLKQLTWKSFHLQTQGNRRNASRVMITLYAINLKSMTYPCVDRLIFRDLKNDLTILDVNANRMKATGNYTSTKGKGYLCQLQFQVTWRNDSINLVMIVHLQQPTFTYLLLIKSGNVSTLARVLSSTPSLLAALHVDALRSTSLYFKSSTPLFNGRYDFIHPLYICGSPRPNVTSDGVINLP